jgi:hypothetical protein
MKIEIQELLQAVENINTDLYKQLGDDTGYILWVTLEPTVGYQCIEWMGDTIWHSEDDPREWIEEVREEHENGSGNWRIVLAHYEDMEPYLRKQIVTLVNKLQLKQL